MIPLLFGLGSAYIGYLAYSWEIEQYKILDVKRDLLVKIRMEQLQSQQE